jgi:hypothetical protein
VSEPLFYTSRSNRPGVVLQASAAKTATGTGTAVSGMGDYRAIEFQCALTAAATASDDTLDVYVQTTLDNGTTWTDVVHFTQMLGDGGAKRYIAKIVWDAALTEFENATALGAAAQRSLMGDQYRVRWAIVDANTQNASFTFSVTANCFG